jgi:hypothetical protein
MEYYVGLDVSLKQTSICVVNQTGSIVQEGVVDSDPEAIASFVRSRAPGTVRIGIETGPTTTWLWTELNVVAGACSRLAPQASPATQGLGGCRVRRGPPFSTAGLVQLM